jgi:ArsR family transcriptional regulator, arsenate/arsenite/antimonite-responsive transcriptional repressor
MNKRSAVLALSALAYETRLGAVELLAEVGEEGVPAGELARRLGVPQNTLSDHLGTLTHADLVTAERQGRSIIYRINPETCERLVSFLETTCLRAQT